MSVRLPFGLSAHLGYLFLERPLHERFAAARKGGFDAVEHPNPVEIPADEMVRILLDNNLVFAQMAAAVGDPSKGEKGLAALPGREGDFLSAFRKAVDYAEAIGCPLLHPMAGVPSPDAPLHAISETYLRNLDAALDVVKGRPVRLLIEAISHKSVPGYYMNKLSQAFALSRSFGERDILVMLDTFHASANGEDVHIWIRTDGERIGHVHVADYPDRHEPGSGLFEFESFINQLKAAGYAGLLGFEYVPAVETTLGLDWIPAWRRHADRKTSSTPTDNRIAP